jgi:hypothetical protein
MLHKCVGPTCVYGYIHAYIYAYNNICNNIYGDNVDDIRDNRIRSSNRMEMV